MRTRQKTLIWLPLLFPLLAGSTKVSGVFGPMYALNISSYDYPFFSSILFSTVCLFKKYLFEKEHSHLLIYSTDVHDGWSWAEAQVWEFPSTGVSIQVSCMGSNSTCLWATITAFPGSAAGASWSQGPELSMGPGDPDVGVLTARLEVHFQFKDCPHLRIDL